MAGLSRSAGQSISRDSPFAEVMGTLQLDAVKFASETGACRLRSDPGRSAASLNCVLFLAAHPQCSPRSARIRTTDDLARMSKGEMERERLSRHGTRLTF